MRSQKTKISLKKGTLNKTALKAGAVTKQTKKKLVTPKKVKKLVNKTSIKNKKNSKDNSSDKSDIESSEGKSEVSAETSKGNKASTSRSESPSKKQKKDTTKTLSESKKIVAKKVVKAKNKPNVNSRISKKIDIDNDDIKYKINLNVGKTGATKHSKAKCLVKKGNTAQKKNVTSQKKEQEDKEKKEEQQSSTSDTSDETNDKKSTDNIRDWLNSDLTKSDKISEPKSNSESCTLNTSNVPTASLLETPKMETERPPKFFTSSRSPRMVDIDVKCCKNSKGNLSMSERFSAMKCEPKVEEYNKDKNLANTLVNQGPEIDVYTFTEKVDSPKSILSDFRSPMNKNIGRVRPIARVKGTVIDKKSVTEKKKYSPHRPIEEVVNKLKANKRSEEIGDQNQTNIPNITDIQKETEDAPAPIVSKSYKMVARKSSVTGKPFSPIKFMFQESSASKSEIAPINTSPKKNAGKTKKQKKPCLSDEDFDSCKFSLNTDKFNYSSSEESVSESNDDNDTKESSASDSQKLKKTKNKKYKKSAGNSKKTSKELRELSKHSLVDLKDDSNSIGEEKPSKRRRKLLSMWTGPKKHRMASLNAIAKVHCLYENESRTHMELGLMKTVDRQFLPGPSKQTQPKKKEVKSKEVEKHDSSNSESEYENKRDKKNESGESSDDSPPQRKLRGVPGIRSAGKYWDPKSSTSSSEDSELESKKKITPEKKKPFTKAVSSKLDNEKPPAKMKKTAGVPVKKKRNRNEVVMDLKDMVVQKRMASLNATAILAASYEKRSPKSNKDETTSDSCSDESFSQKSKNGVGSGVKSEIKCEDTKKDDDHAVITDRKQKVEVIVNQDTDVTITGVYQTHLHEGFCTVSGMQYRISSTSHTQTTATADSEKEGCSREDRYTPLTALSSMQPPADQLHTHSHPVPELGGLGRRAAGCSSAFSAPSPSAHHDPGYYQPAGPLIKESGADAERAIARYHPPPHYHPPHPPVLQQYGPYYPPDLCYSRYYRPPGPPYHMPPQPDAQMVGVGSDSYPPQYYSTPPCYQHSPQRIPYVEYRGCPCPLNACPKNVHIGPATGKAPTGGGPGEVSSVLALPGGAFRAKVRAHAIDAGADSLSSGKDPPLEPEPPAAADAPHPCPLPAIGGASPKREIFDVRDKLRLAGDLPGPTEAIGPLSPARGSAGACAPQPPPVVPRRARLGKAMARRSLAGDDTGLLLSTPQPPPHHSDADDDVMAISPPICAPIDLSSSDERSTPLVDVKKENEGPPCASIRKTDAQALREHNCTASLTEPQDSSEVTKPAKRRYSRPKLEIDMKDTLLEEGCKTNCIGEHVKLQKRRKVSCEQTVVARVEATSTRDAKKKPTPRKGPRTPNAEKRAQKRKLGNHTNSPKAKKVLIESSVEQDPRLNNVAALPEDLTSPKPKNKSALLLDNLLRKNSSDKIEPASKEINPAELFLSPLDSCSQTSAKKTLNINNNIVENSNTPSGVRPNTIAAVSQLLAYKNACKVEKVDSKVTQSLKSVLKSPNDKLNSNEDSKLLTSKSKVTKIEYGHITSLEDSAKHKITKTPKSNLIKTEKQMKLIDESHIVSKDEPGAGIMYKLNEGVELTTLDKSKLQKLAVKKSNGQLKNKSIEKVAKLLSKNSLGAINQSIQPLENANICENKVSEVVNDKLNTSAENTSLENVVKLLGSKKLPSANESMEKETERPRPVDITIEGTDQDKIVTKRCKLSNGELKPKKKEHFVKLLVLKKPAIKTDEATLVIEDACASPVPSIRKPRRRRSGGARRMRRPIAPLAEPTLESRAPPRWSNGWKWDSENYVSKVYLNNDSRLDRTARCYTRMSHESGDTVGRGDCVLLRASVTRAQPFVARVASLWENPEDGEMMVSLVWYYRPEHTEIGREPRDAPDEVFASRHRDANSVACIEDKCYVLTFNEYCRYRKRLKAAEEGVAIRPSIVPPLPPSEITPAVAPNDSKLPPSVSPELVLFCRKIYDFRSKKIQVSNK